mgnify:CR=1 FL=1
MLEKKINMVSLDKVSIDDNFWKDYMELVRSHVIPYQWEALNDRIEGAEPSYCMQNFKVAAGKKIGKFQGMVFQDSDAYKWLEAVAYSLMWHPDSELEKTADGAIDLICDAQQEDGYLDTYYILNGLEKRFTNLMDHHEMYCLGHMIEGAVAYYRATGKRKFLDCAIRYVDCVSENIGPEPEKLPGYPGHEVAEMALVELYRVTGDRKHLELAKYFIDQRGQEPLYFDQERKAHNNVFHWEHSYYQYQYYQAGKPVRKQFRAEGHAVRAVYLYTGMAEVASVTEDQELLDVCKKLWNNIVGKQMYVTGAIGSSQYGEAFTFDYDLPNDTIYAETCAAIGLVFFARRMLEITGESRYADVMERCLYNGVISGMSLDGKKFFYVNPLEAVPEASEKDFYKKHVKIERQKWFGCACCPPNVARLLSSIGGYAYEANLQEFYMNLFIGGNIEQTLGGAEQRFSVQTKYPWEGDVHIDVENGQDSEYAFAIRIPGWCGAWTLKINGESAEYPMKNGYVYVRRIWSNGDTMDLHMEMPVQRIVANPRVREDVGKAALMRGPVVYCLEEADNGDLLQDIYLKRESEFDISYEKELLNGVVTITADGKRLSTGDWKEDVLYKPCFEETFKEQKLKFIPYYSWSNRGAGEMLVWVHMK